MKYTVVWQPSAERRLAEIWNDAADRGAVSAAANAIDALLRTNPQLQGEPLDDVYRALVVPPLLVAFKVIEEDRQVVVLLVSRVTLDA